MTTTLNDRKESADIRIIATDGKTLTLRTKPGVEISGRGVVKGLTSFEVTKAAFERIRESKKFSIEADF